MPLSVRIQTGDTPARALWIPDSGMTVGRQHPSDLIIPDPVLSRRHLRLEKKNGLWMVTDLGSRNGVILNGTPVMTAFLKTDDAIRIGNTTVTICGERVDDPVKPQECVSQGGTSRISPNPVPSGNRTATEPCPAVPDCAQGPGHPACPRHLRTSSAYHAFLVWSTIFQIALVFWSSAYLWAYVIAFLVSLVAGCGLLSQFTTADNASTREMPYWAYGAGLRHLLSLMLLVPYVSALAGICIILISADAHRARGYCWDFWGKCMNHVQEALNPFGKSRLLVHYLVCGGITAFILVTGTVSGLTLFLADRQQSQHYSTAIRAETSQQRTQYDSYQPPVVAHNQEMPTQQQYAIPPYQPGSQPFTIPSMNRSSSALMRQPRDMTCPFCKGSGTNSMPCLTCKGTGMWGNSKCTSCNGRGFQSCSSCRGTGRNDF